MNETGLDISTGVSRRHIERALEVFQIESAAISSLGDRLDAAFPSAVETILNATGRVIVCGMGKSGIIGKKISATMASTGTPSFFMHPGEAYHGDLGMVVPADIFIAISFSGETDEILKLLPFLKENGNYLIGITGHRESTLSQACHCHLDVGVDREACSLQLAPTASTTAALAMGDALAVALMEARGFQPESFARFHPGGSLGRRLLSRVGDEMIKQPLPTVHSEALLMEVIRSITNGGLGLTIVELNGSYGIITDGDVRRAVENSGSSIFELNAAGLMSAAPVCVAATTRCADAIELMDSRAITSVLVKRSGEIVGVFKK